MSDDHSYDWAELIGADARTRSTLEELAAARAFRDAADAGNDGDRELRALRDGLSDDELAKVTPQSIRARISQAAFDMIVYYEVSDRPSYERETHRPTWPGLYSGITIGIGYDIGQLGLAQFTKDWKSRLPADQFERLSRTASITGKAAERLVDGLHDISIPWDIAFDVFENITVPAYSTQVLKLLANVNDLHPHCFGALVSLVFNRSAGQFMADGDRYREMRAIRAHMYYHRFDGIPGELRKMRRLWVGQGVAGLLKRRDHEAQMFEAGLRASALDKLAVMASANGATRGIEGPPATPRGVRYSAEADENWLEVEQEAEGERKVLGGPQPEDTFSKNDVSWAVDTDNPDYCHLDASFPGKEPTFSFTASDLELIIQANDFEPERKNGVILFGLRGAELPGGRAQINQEGLRLRQVRPDHRAFRCVIGAYNIGTHLLSGFVASTVPNIGAVYLNWWRYRTGGEPYGNLLPTGCYSYYVGTHGGRSREVPGAFRLDEREEVVVLRSDKDVRYDTTDRWDPCMPNDNIHPAFFELSFSSAGCQTVRGNYTDEAGHTGDWAEFRRAVGLKERGSTGKAFSYVLVTGLEAAIAAKLRATGGHKDHREVFNRLTRLRHGSRSSAVGRLQKALRRPETGKLGADDITELTALQRGKLGWSSGVYSPDMDARLAMAEPVFQLADQTDGRGLGSLPTSRVALVIGNGKYASASQLANPMNDAGAITEKLKSLRFTVSTLVNAPKDVMIQAISEFLRRLNNSETEAGVVFFAGHGVQIHGENYILPVDCRAGSEFELHQTSLPVNELINQLQLSRKTSVVFLDCCRNDPFPSHRRAIGGAGLAPIIPPPGVFVAFATSPGATASDGPGKPNSPFTTALLEFIVQAGVNISTMMIRVRKAVLEATAGRQLPWDMSTLTLDFSFDADARSLGPPPQVDAAARQEEYWALTSQSDNPQIYRSFLMQFPYSRHRTEARERIRRLELRRKVTWGSFVLTAATLLVGLLLGVQYLRLAPTLEHLDLVGGDILLQLVGNTVGAETPEDAQRSLMGCRFSCAIRPFTCVAYSFDATSKKCYLKKEVRYSRADDKGETNVSGVLWGMERPQPAPFSVDWTKVYKLDNAILPDGSRAPLANPVDQRGTPEQKLLNDDYNVWGHQVAVLRRTFPSLRADPGIACQDYCVEQKSCRAFTYNAVNGRCKLYESRPPSNSAQFYFAARRFGSDDPVERMHFAAPAVYSGEMEGR